MFAHNHVTYHKGNILSKLLVKTGVVIVYALLTSHLVITASPWQFVCYRIRMKFPEFNEIL